MAKTAMEQGRGTGGLAKIDRVAIPAQRAVERFFDAVPPLRDALTGKLLGHPLHPVLNDIPIGAWTAGFALDMAESFGGKRKLRRGADAVHAIGLVGAVVATAAGIADWSRTGGQARRVGFIHGAANLAIAGLYGGSLLARRACERTLGITLSNAGFALMLASGALGSIVAYRLGALPRPEATRSSEALARNDGAAAGSTATGGRDIQPSSPGRARESGASSEAPGMSGGMRSAGMSGTSSSAGAGEIAMGHGSQAEPGGAGASEPGRRLQPTAGRTPTR